MDNKEAAAVFKAFSDENRLKILQLHRGEEKCACSILKKMHITQPTLSHHMKILCGTGVVVGRKDGKTMKYTLSKDRLTDIEKYLDELADGSDNNVKRKGRRIH